MEKKNYFIYLKSRIKKSLKNKNLATTIIILLFLAATILYIGMFGYLFILVFKLDLTITLNKLGIPSIPKLYLSLAGLYLFVVIGLFIIRYFIEYYFINLKQVHSFLARIINVYFLLAIGLTTISLLVGTYILTYDYGSTLPKNFDLNAYENENYINFTSSQVQNLSKVNCYDVDRKRFVIANHQIRCDFDIILKKESNLILESVSICDLKNSGICESQKMSQYKDDHWFFINVDEMGFNIYFSLVFKNLSISVPSNVLTRKDTIEPYIIPYKEDALTLEEYRDLENKKNILLVSLLSIFIFSILSAVVNIKKLTEKPK